MGKNRFKDAQARREGGGFVPLPFVVIRSQSFTRLSAHAVKLLNDLLAQYKGDNNGDLCAAWTLMQPRGWKSKDTLNKALEELLAGDWLEVTRQGGRHKATLYAADVLRNRRLQGKAGRAVYWQPKGYMEKKRAIASPAKIKSRAPPGGLIVGRLTRLAYQLIFGLHELTRRAYQSRHYFKTN